MFPALPVAICSNQCSCTGWVQTMTVFKHRHTTLCKLGCKKCWKLQAASGRTSLNCVTVPILIHMSSPSLSQPPVQLAHPPGQGQYHVQQSVPLAPTALDRSPVLPQLHFDHQLLHHSDFPQSFGAVLCLHLRCRVLWTF